MVDFFGKEGKEGVQQTHGGMENVVECLLHAALLLGCTVAQQTLTVLDEDIAQLVVEELIRDLCRPAELARLERVVNTLNGLVQAVENPAFGDGEGCGLECSGGEVRRELAQHVLAGLVDLVAETTVSSHDLDVKIDITTASSIRFV